MPKANVIQTNFTTGEVGPLLYGRPDLQKYYNGAAELFNFVVKPQGAIYRRPATKYINSTKDGSKKAVMIPFVFSTDQAYGLEVGENYIRFYKDGGIILSGGVPVEVVTTYTEDELDNLYYGQSADVLYLTHQNHPPQTLSRFSDTSWTLADFSHEDGPYLDIDDSDTTLTLQNIVSRATLKSTASDFTPGDVGKFVEYFDEGFEVLGEIITYVSATEVTIEPAQNVVASQTIDEKAVVEYAASDATFPDRLRSSTTIWSTESEDSYIKVDGTWYLTSDHLAENEEIPEVTGPPKAPAYSVDLMEVASTPTMLSTSGNITVSNKTITATLVASEDTFENTRDVGRQFRLNYLDKWIWGTITAYTGTKQVSVSLNSLPPVDPKKPSRYINNGKTPIWRLGAWYEDNYPRVSTIHEQRLVFAATPLEEQTIWMSQSGNYTSFSPSDFDSQVLDSNAITRTIGSNTVNAILWLQSARSLLIGTVGEEFQGRASTINEAITPANFQITPQTSHGSKDTSFPHKIGSSTIFIQRAGNKLRKLTYSFEIDAFVASYMNILNNHIFEKYGGAIKSAYQSEADGIIWIICTTGELVGCTFEEEQQVVAFHHHNVNGVVESDMVIPSATGDELWLIVRRIINGSTVRYVERMDPRFNPSDENDKDDMVFMDSYLKYEGAAATVISGLDHLEGEEVAITADGSTHPPKTVSSGQITLDYESSLVYIGIGYSSKVKLLTPEGGSPYGTSAGKIQKLEIVDILLESSLDFNYGFDENDLLEESFRSDDDFQDSSPPLFSGYRRIIPDLGYGVGRQFIIETSLPTPLTILNVVQTFRVNE